MYCTYNQRSISTDLEFEHFLPARQTLGEATQDEGNSKREAGRYYKPDPPRTNPFGRGWGYLKAGKQRNTRFTACTILLQYSDVRCPSELKSVFSSDDLNLTTYVTSDFRPTHNRGGGVGTGESIRCVYR